ncbi:MAG: hypothetical protein F4072_03835, partial [Acidimicrobiaceae bacterium]|nr:hypothetical protein [Acidimicrobiaceae bacterium]
MTTLIVAVLLVVGGAVTGIALDRVRLRRWLRRLSPEGRSGPEMPRSARRFIEAAQRRGDVAAAGRVSSVTAAR